HRVFQTTDRGRLCVLEAAHKGSYYRPYNFTTCNSIWYPNKFGKIRQPHSSIRSLHVHGRKCLRINQRGTRPETFLRTNRKFFDLANKDGSAVKYVKNLRCVSSRTPLVSYSNCPSRNENRIRHDRTFGTAIRISPPSRSNAAKRPRTSAGSRRC